MWRAGSIFLMITLSGCGGSGDAPDAGSADAGMGQPDAGASDAGASDAGASDAGASDAGASDAGAPDAATNDAGVFDAGAAPDIGIQLAALPGVTAQEQSSAPPGYRYFVLLFTQPVDHAAPNGPTFQQEVSLIHRDVSAPMVAETSGYDDYLLDDVSEPAELLGANQISIEHRFFGTSIPQPADWTKLTIKQMADDEHAIIAALKSIYPGPWISTGASKGGMTAVYHRRFYPADVVGTIAYVAPLSQSIPDARYSTFIDAIGPQTCADAIRAVATELLQNRRAAMLTRATAQATANGYSYTRIAIGPAVESAIEDLEWSYWQYFGTNLCTTVPATTASDAELFQFLDEVSSVFFSDDDQIARFEAYFYQAYNELGSPGLASVRGDWMPQQLVPFRMFNESDYAGTLPLGVAAPTFDASVMQDIDTWVQTSGADLVFVYGGWDPWSGGMFHLGSATDSLELTVLEGTHDSSVAELATADRTAVYAKLAAWTGIPLHAPHARPHRSRDPRRALTHAH